MKSVNPLNLNFKIKAIYKQAADQNTFSTANPDFVPGLVELHPDANKGQMG